MNRKGIVGESASFVLAGLEGMAGAGCAGPPPKPERQSEPVVTFQSQELSGAQPC